MVRSRIKSVDLIGIFGYIIKFEYTNHNKKEYNMDSKIQGHKTKDMQEVDGYNDIPTIDVKRLLIAISICGIMIIGAVLILP